jgi:sugar/nucleoside kinase (ribokinase family)
MTRRLGVIGTLVWDEIHNRDPLTPAVEEWGGIAYALAGLDAALPADWELVPLIKVGRDLASEAAQLLETIEHRAPSARFIEVPQPNNRVVLRYVDDERRFERMSGGVPGWTWPELGPMVADLDAIYINFISGFELQLGTVQALRHGFDGPIYADLHSLLLGTLPDGIRELQPLSHAGDWFACLDVVQLNEAELQQFGPDPLAVAATALAAGVSLFAVTLGSQGVAYFAQTGFDRLGDLPRRRRDVSGLGAAVRTARMPAAEAAAVDTTGCGDVFGATCFARMLAGDDLESALTRAIQAAGRNTTFRGATGLARHLRGNLVNA